MRSSLVRRCMLGAAVVVPTAAMIVAGAQVAGAVTGETFVSTGNGSTVTVTVGNGSVDYIEIPLSIDFTSLYPSDDCTGTPTGTVSVTDSGSPDYQVTSDETYSYLDSYSDTSGIFMTACIVLPSGTMTGNYDTGGLYDWVIAGTDDTASYPYAVLTGTFPSSTGVDVTGCTIYGIANGATYGNIWLDTSGDNDLSTDPTTQSISQAEVGNTPGWHLLE